MGQKAGPEEQGLRRDLGWALSLSHTHIHLYRLVLYCPHGDLISLCGPMLPST